MTISSRTLGGIPHRCPICGHEEDMEVSHKTGDSCCPSCGQLMWRKEHSTGPEYNGRRRRSSQKSRRHTSAKPQELPVPFTMVPQEFPVPSTMLRRDYRPTISRNQALTKLMYRFLSLFLPREVRTGWCTHYFVTRRDS